MSGSHTSVREARDSAFMKRITRKLALEIVNTEPHGLGSADRAPRFGI